MNILNLNKKVDFVFVNINNTMLKQNLLNFKD